MFWLGESSALEYVEVKVKQVFRTDRGIVQWPGENRTEASMKNERRQSASRQKKNNIQTQPKDTMWGETAKQQH